MIDMQLLVNVLREHAMAPRQEHAPLPCMNEESDPAGPDTPLVQERQNSIHEKKTLQTTLEPPGQSGRRRQASLWVVCACVCVCVCVCVLGPHGSLSTTRGGGPPDTAGRSSGRRVRIHGRARARTTRHPPPQGGM
jgi:hypothetical protein